MGSFNIIFFSIIHVIQEQGEGMVILMELAQSFKFLLCEHGTFINSEALLPSSGGSRYPAR